MTPPSPFTDVPTTIEEIRAGRMIVVIDDEDRENEGDLTLAAEKVTPEAINFMAKHARGLVCMAMTEERLDHQPAGNRSGDTALGFGAAGTRLPATGAQGRSAGARGTDGSFGGFGAAGRHGPGGDHLRNHERRRHHGARAGPDRVLPPARNENADGGGVDPLPHAA